MSDASAASGSQLRPICFMITPYREKATGVATGKGPATVDFEALWEKVFRPVIEELGYRPVRADEDLGSLIITQMIERLALSDLVLAEVTTPNPNVYYEVGVRHVAKPDGCILVCAEWASQNFDLEQIRQFRYPLSEGTITDDTASAARTALVDGIRGLLPGASPFHEIFPNWPNGAEERAKTMEEQLRKLADFRAELRTVELAPKEERKERARQVWAHHRDTAAAMPGVATALLFLFQRLADWKGLMDLVDSMPERIRKAAVFQEQYSLARAKLGNEAQAIADYEQLIAAQGETAERRGLIGGRYRQLLARAQTPKDKAVAMERAIDNYRTGMLLDLNEYFCASNLHRLYRMRGDEGDDELAREAGTITRLACQRALARDPNDRWVRLTQLGLAFLEGDVPWARQLYKEVLQRGADSFSLQSTIPDLEAALGMLPDPAAAAPLRDVLEKLKALHAA